VKTQLGELTATQKWRQDQQGKEVLIAFRPEQVSILGEGQPAGGGNVLRGELQGFTYLGESTEFQVLVGSQRIQAKGEAGLALKRGSQVSLHIAVEDCLLIRRGEV
jgi:ABC-type Fe3+/spermidine/putrescine transport system ATPase subunit